MNSPSIKILAAFGAWAKCVSQDTAVERVDSLKTTPEGVSGNVRNTRGLCKKVRYAFVMVYPWVMRFWVVGLVLGALLPSARGEDCTGILKKVLLTRLLGGGGGGVVAEVKMADGTLRAAKFHFKGPSERPRVGGVQAIALGSELQQALAEKGLAPRFYGASADPAVMADLVKQLPEKMRNRIDSMNGVAFVTLHELISGATALHYETPISASEARRIRKLVAQNASSIQRQLEQAEEVFRKAGVEPSEVQGALVQSPEGLRLQLFDFDEVRRSPGTLGELEDVRDDLARFGLEN